MSKSKIIIITGFTSILILVFITSFIGMNALLQSNKQFERFVTINQRKIQLSNDLRTAARERTFSLLRMLSLKDESALQNEVDRIARFGGQFAADREEYLLLADPDGEEQVLLKQHDTLVKIAGPLQNEIVDFILFDEYETAQRLITEELLPLQDEEVLLMDRMISLHQQQGLDSIAKNKKNCHSIIQDTWIMLVFVLLISISIVVFVLRLLERNEIQQESSQHRLEIALDDANKANQAKSQLLSNMSHELRTPLHAIMGFSEIIACKNDLDSKLEKYNQRIFNASKHLLTLVDDVLDLSRLENGKLALTIKQINLDNVLQECHSMIKPIAEEAQLDITFNSDIAYTVLADAQRLKQALLNLLSNAIKYNSPAGSIIVTSETRKDDRLRITITDTGSGMSDQQQRNLFKPFERLGAENGSVQGTGIGLVITQQLIELMGGVIGVKSTVGQGSTFWVDLNLAK